MGCWWIWNESIALCEGILLSFTDEYDILAIRRLFASPFTDRQFEDGDFLLPRMSWRKVRFTMDAGT